MSVLRSRLRARIGMRRASLLRTWRIFYQPRTMRTLGSRAFSNGRSATMEPGVGLHVAIVGRPNVGKSTLFNRLVGRKKALVNKEAGVTRDWQHSEGWLAGLPLQLYDTAGFEQVEKVMRQSKKRSDILPGRQLTNELKEAILKQTESVISKSHIIVLVVDAREGVTPEDEYYAQWLRSRVGFSTESICRSSGTKANSTTTGASHSTDHKKPILLVANKCEGLYDEGTLLSMESTLGLGDIVPISAAHGEGMADLYHAFQTAAEEFESATGVNLCEGGANGKGVADTSAVRAGEGGDEAATAKNASSKELLHQSEPMEPLRLAIVGRPNVGKSTLLNTLSGSERALASPIPGTTRNTVTVKIMAHDASSSSTSGSSRNKQHKLHHVPDGRSDSKSGQHQQQHHHHHHQQQISIELTDTAGVKRVKSVLRNQTIDLFGEVDTAAMAQALDTIRRSHVACLLVDATGSNIEPDEAVSFEASDYDVRCLPARAILTQNDLRIAQFAEEEGRPLTVLLNKWDEVPAEARQGLKRACMGLFYDILTQSSKGVPLLTTNSKAIGTLQQVVPTAQRLHSRWSSRVPTNALNRWLQAVVAYKPPPNIGGKPVTPKFISQIDTRPPTFSINVARVANLPKSYQKFLTNSLREEFGLHGVPIRVRFRSPSNPYSKDGKGKRGSNKSGNKRRGGAKR